MCFWFTPFPLTCLKVLEGKDKLIENEFIEVQLYYLSLVLIFLLL